MRLQVKSLGKGWNKLAWRKKLGNDCGRTRTSTENKKRENVRKLINKEKINGMCRMSGGNVFLSIRNTNKKRTRISDIIGWHNTNIVNTDNTVGAMQKLWYWSEREMVWAKAKKVIETDQVKILWDLLIQWNKILENFKHNMVMLNRVWHFNW